MANTRKSAYWPVIYFASSIIISCASHAQPITLYYNAEQKPKAWLDINNQPNGFAYEVAASILDKAEIEFTAKAVPFMRGITSTKHCKGIMTGVFKTKAREQFLNYSLPIVADKAVVVSRIEDNFIYTKMTDLLNHKIVYLRGASFGNAFANIEFKLDKVTHQNPAIMLRLLVRKRVDLVILNPGLATVEFAAQAANINMQKFRVSDTALSEVDNYLVYCKKAPKSYLPIFNRINAAIEALKRDGTFDNIMKSY